MSIQEHYNRTDDIQLCQMKGSKTLVMYSNALFGVIQSFYVFPIPQLAEVAFATAAGILFYLYSVRDAVILPTSLTVSNVVVFSLLECIDSSYKC